MIYKAFVGGAVLCYLLASSSAPVNAQTLATERKSTAVKVSDEKNPAPSRAGSVDTADGKRASAIATLLSLADESNTFKDQALRVRVQARAADALWDGDQARARNLFLRAWEAAEKIDRDGEQPVEEARRKVSPSGQGVTFIPPAPNLRFEVLKLAARRDRLLGEKLLARLEEAKGQEPVNDSGGANETGLSFFDPTEPPAAIAKRLDLATELVKTGDAARAKMFADPALNYATSQGLIFLGTLRQRDPGAADERYARLLELAANDPSADATTVSLLSSYVFTPNLLVTATRRGRVSNRWGDVGFAPEAPAELRSNFLRVAAEILLRPLLPTEQDRTSAGRSGTYFTTKRLLPLFERYAPEQLPALNARLAVLERDTTEVYKNDDNGMLTAGIVPEKPGGDDVSNILGQLSNATGTDLRDLIYVKAIRAAAAKGDGRIREFADRIENTDLKKRARAFADFVMARRALGEKDVEGVIRIAGAGNLPPLHRVWAYTEAAGLLKESDAPRAIQLLDNAISEAQGISSGEPERVYALACAASHFFKFDRARTWELTAEVIKASNAVAVFTPDDSKLRIKLQARDVFAAVNVDVPSFNLAGLFETLGTNDFYRANTMAGGLKGEAPRAAANLAVARSALRRHK